MTTENDCFKGLCGGKIHRRDFLKMALATGILTTGCSNTKQKQETVLAENPPSSPTITSSQPTAIATLNDEDFNRMAYCGLKCWVKCPEHEYPASCGGCKSEGGKLGHFCAVCAIRKCASEKQVLTCAHCDEYPSCEIDTWTKYPVLRKIIDRIRNDLQSRS